MINRYIKIPANIFVCILFFNTLLTAKLETKKAEVVHKQSNALIDNLDVDGVPKKFMRIILSYVEVNSNDALYTGHDVDRKEKSSKIINQIKNEYIESSEDYFLKIVKTNKSSLLRRYAYSIFIETGLNNGSMLDYSRISLRNKSWEDGIHLDYDIRNQLKILVAYGDESDLLLWDEIWGKMDEREQHSFKVYRKMLTKGLERKDKTERAKAARGDKQAQRKLFDEDSEDEELDSSVFENKQLVVMGIVVIAFVMGYIFLRKKARS